MKVLNDLNDVTYKELKEQLEGKNGLNQQVSQMQQQLGEIETLINQKEGDLGELYKEDYRTKNRAKRKELKQRKNDDPNLALKPKTKARKKAKNKRQTGLIELYAGYDETLEALDVLIEERNEVAKEFESIFLAEFLKQARQGELAEGMFSSEAGKTFQGMLDVEVARSSSTGISLGLAEAIVTQLGAGLSDQVK